MPLRSQFPGPGTQDAIPGEDEERDAVVVPAELVKGCCEADQQQRGGDDCPTAAAHLGRQQCPENGHGEPVCQIDAAASTRPSASARAQSAKAWARAPAAPGIRRGASEPQFASSKEVVQEHGKGRRERPGRLRGGAVQPGDRAVPTSSSASDAPMSAIRIRRCSPEEHHATITARTGDTTVRRALRAPCCRHSGWSGVPPQG